MTGSGDGVGNGATFDENVKWMRQTSETKNKNVILHGAGVPPGGRGVCGTTINR
jgi:hypothetical protein